MKMLKLFVVAAMAMISSAAFAQGTCDNPLRQTDVCYSMQHLRSQINAVDAQRELMQVNFPYLETLGKNIALIARDVHTKIQMDSQAHRDGIKNVAVGAEDLAKLAAKKDPNALVVGNLLRARCVTCHTSETPASGIVWDKVFKNDWEHIAKRCNQVGRNPYLCKSMNGMLSAYGYFITSMKTGEQNYELTAEASGEVLRILKELKDKGVMHMSEGFRAAAEDSAAEINKLALAKDPSVFEKVLELPNSCMNCHDSRGVVPGVNSVSKGNLSVWNVNAIK
jgi:hypothetical protein